MPSALQSPLRHAEARPVGRHLFRKQLLPFDKIEYEGREIRFDRPYHSALIDAFEQGAFPQVPFVLVDAENKHTMDPERYRGEVAGLELTSDGLDALIDLSDDGAELIRRNPRLGVSARILEDMERADGRRFPLCIQHVAGTTDPQIGGLKGWEAVSDLSASYGHGQVLDLTGETYPDEMADTDTQRKPLELSEEEEAKFRQLLEGSERLSDLPADLSDEEEEAISEFVKLMRDQGEESESEGESEEENTEEGQREVAATLSAEHERAIELAKSEAHEAQGRAEALERRLAEADFLEEKRRLVSKGVPPVAVDLAKPLLTGERVIELSASEKVDAGKVVRDLLKQMEGTINLSGEQGSSFSDEDAAAEERRRKALDDWEKAAPSRQPEPRFVTRTRNGGDE